MSRILVWIRAHKAETVFIILGALLLPLVLVHIAYRINAISPWFSSTWDSGDLITYIAGFEAFLGTIALGSATVYQSETANKLSNSLLEIEAKRSMYERKPDLQINTKTAAFTPFSEFLAKEREADSMIYVEYQPDSISLVPDANKKMIHLAFEVINIGNAPFFINLQSLSANKVTGNEERKLSLFDLSTRNPKSLLHPYISLVYEFAIYDDDFFRNGFSLITFSFTLSNIIDEKHNFEACFLATFLSNDTITFHLYDRSLSIKPVSD